MTDEYEPDWEPPRNPYDEHEQPLHWQRWVSENIPALEIQ